MQRSRRSREPRPAVDAAVARDVMNSSGWRAFTTRDPEEARGIIAKAYSACSLDTAGEVRDFEMSMRSARLPGLSLARISFQTDVRVFAPPPNSYVVCYPISGALDVSTGDKKRHLIHPHGAVMNSNESVYFENWSADCELVSVRIDRSEVDRALTGLLGRSLDQPVLFDMKFDRDDAGTVSLVRALHLLEAEASAPGALLESLGTAAVLKDLVVTALLASQPNNYSVDLGRSTSSRVPESVRAACDLIDNDPTRFTTVAGLAAAVHASVRSLEEGFRSHLNMSPMTYQRRIRLKRAHNDLVHADARSHTAAGIARQWGFSHYGRFAQMYCETYGVRPAESLRRAGLELDSA